ncbi:MAG TPA: hypothetical protein VEK57_02290 [Thermoanaerobaculia bacterium]|nr:hypothetical protein [Thermoanaerobaculia bacterium]
MAHAAHTRPEGRAYRSFAAFGGSREFRDSRGAEPQNDSVGSASSDQNLRSALTLLTHADGHTDHLQLAAALDALRALRHDAAPAAETLSALLPHRSRLYEDRDKTLVIRLRSYILVTLSEIGYPESAMPALFDILAHVDERMTALEVGAAVRAAGSLGPRGRELASYLLDTLADRFAGEEFSLDRYDSDFPPAEATTVYVETIRALGRICSAEDAGILAALNRFAATHPSLAPEASLATQLIAARGERP